MATVIWLFDHNPRAKSIRGERLEDIAKNPESYWIVAVSYDNFMKTGTISPHDLWLNSDEADGIVYIYFWLGPLDALLMKFAFTDSSTAFEFKLRFG